MNASIALPDAPCVVAGHGRAAILTPDGEVLLLSAADAAAALRNLPPPILVHAPATFRRLGMRPSQAFDLLDLFAFVRPAETVAPTPRGLALALDDLRPMRGPEDAVTRLPDLAAALLNRLAQARDTLLNRDAAALAARMQQAGWLWGGYVTHALRPARRRRIERTAEGLENPAGVGRGRAAARRHPRIRSRPAEARTRLADDAGPARRTAPRPVRLCQRRRRCLRAAPDQGRSPFRAGGGRHRDRQDPGLSRPGQRSGRKRTRAPSGSAPSPATCSARSTPNWPASFPTRPRGTAVSSCARGGRTTSAC